MQWANEGSEDSGVNVEMAFSRFDRYRRGAIDPLEVRQQNPSYSEVHLDKNPV